MTTRELLEKIKDNGSSIVGKVKELTEIVASGSGSTSTKMVIFIM